MPFLPVFESRVDEYLGADLPENAKAHLPLVDGRLPIGPEEADVVLSTQVLEHVESPEIYLRECQRVLRIGGLLILSTHGHWPFHPTPHDHWRWTHSGLTRLVEDAGFEGIEVRASMNLLETGVQFIQEGVRRRFRAAALPLVALTQNVALPLLAALTTTSRLLDGALLIVVARRRA
jgi:SAM-dependent methyltransferase